MNDPFDFDGLLSDALHAEDDDAVAGPELYHRIAQQVGQRRPSRLRRLAPWLAVAAAVALVAGVVTALPNDDREGLDVADDPNAPTTSVPGTEDPSAGLTDTNALPCSIRPDTDVAAYLQPTASDADIAAMGARIEDDGRVSDVSYVDQEEAYAQFRELFADQPQLLATVTPDILPTAFLVNLVHVADAEALRAELAAAPGAYQTFVVDCGSSPPVAAGRPAIAVAVTKDGRLVVIDVATGEEVRELAALDDPTAVPPRS